MLLIQLVKIMNKDIKKIKEFLYNRNFSFEFWNEIGLLGTLEKNDKMALALKLEEMAKLLVEDSNASNDIVNKIENNVLIIVARTFVKHNYLIKSCPNTLNFIVSKSDFLTINISHCPLDLETEFCALMAEEISNLKL